MTKKCGYELAIDAKITKSRQKRKERNLWQRRFWEHLIRVQGRSEGGDGETRRKIQTGTLTPPEFERLNPKGSVGVSNPWDLRPRVTASPRHRVFFDEKDFANHCDYIHYNRVKHGLCKTPREWQFSSLHRFVEQGLYAEDWGVYEIPDLLPTVVGE